MLNQVNQVQNDLYSASKRVKLLRFQLKDIDQKNLSLQSKLSGIKRLQRQKHDQSPVEILQENLHLDRKSVLECFRQIKEQEGQYIRHQRHLTQQQLRQAKEEEFQQKKNKVKQIEQFESALPQKKAEFLERKILQIKQMENQYLEQNHLQLYQKVKEIAKLKSEENELLLQYELAKNHEQALSQKLVSAISCSNSKLLPTISKSHSKSSHARSATPVKYQVSPFQSSGKVFERIYSNKKEDRQQACQTSFDADKTPSMIYSMHFDSYQTQKRTLEKSIPIE